MMVHILNELASPVESSTWTMYCGEFDSGEIAPQIDFVLENAKDKATCDDCKAKAKGAVRKVSRNLTTIESRRFWRHAVRVANRVATWPAWKKAGVLL